MREGLPDKNKSQILEIYPRKGEFYTEAPKINTEILLIVTDIGKKRDQHFRGHPKLRWIGDLSFGGGNIDDARRTGRRVRSRKIFGPSKSCRSTVDRCVLSTVIIAKILYISLTKQIV